MNLFASLGSIYVVISLHICDPQLPTLWMKDDSFIKLADMCNNIFWLFAEVNLIWFLAKLTHFYVWFLPLAMWPDLARSHICFDSCSGNQSKIMLIWLLLLRDYHHSVNVKKTYNLKIATEYLAKLFEIIITRRCMLADLWSAVEMLRNGYHGCLAPEKFWGLM